MRTIFIISAFILIGLHILSYFFLPIALWAMIITIPLLVIGFRDYFQKSQAIRRNFPVVGNFRYLLEMIRPEINQYFIESNSDGVPFSRENRSVVYQRSKKVLDTLPFGTQLDVYQTGYEFVTHSMAPTHPQARDLRVNIGGPHCKHPYNASILNISAMSFGSLSSNAILALNGGAKDGHFAHNTGEGGISRYHREPGGDLIWQIGTGYFGCRTKEGNFNPETFQKNALDDQIKMIEIKISQGAKPGHGGILPKAKITPEIAEIRHVSTDNDVVSPPAHSAFKTPLELINFIQQLRDLSKGKPIGIKLCLGNRHEFFALCKAMVETSNGPDYIVVDASEGGTGAAPIEFSNRIGIPGTDALIFVNNLLIGFGLRDKIKIFATGKVTTGFGVVKLLSLGADVVYSARAMMMSLGCIQALRCNSNHCPTGVATQDPNLVAGLVPTNKRVRVANYHSETIESVAHMLGAMGVKSPDELSPYHIKRRMNHFKIMSYADFITPVQFGQFLKNDIPENYLRHYSMASSKSFEKISN